MNPAKTLFTRLLLLTIALTVFLLACKKEDVQNNSTDPLIGSWKMKALIVNGQSTDVSNAACFKNSTLNVNAKEFTMYTSVPKDDGGCEENTSKAAWVNAGGKYYEVNGEERILLDLSFRDNNQIVQINAPNGSGGTIGLVYGK